MDRIYLLDEVTKIRRLLLEKEGRFSSEECEKIAAVLEMDNVLLVAMLEAIRKDLLSKKFVLDMKQAERFQLLRSALQKNAEHVLIKKITPKLIVLDENFRKSQADEEACREAVGRLRSLIEPYADKVPKLVKYLNEYAGLCEANFLNVVKLKVLRINLRFLPILKEVNEWQTACDNVSDEKAYLEMAEQLYLKHSSLFKKEDIYYFGIIRGILDAFYRELGKEPVQLDVPAEITLLEDVQPEIPVAAEGKAEDTAEVTEEAETEGIATGADLPEAEPEQPVVESEQSAAEPKPKHAELESEQVIEPEQATESEQILGSEQMEPEQIESEQIEPDPEQVEPESEQAESEPEPEMKQPEPMLPEPQIKPFDSDVQKDIPKDQQKSRKSVYIAGGCALLVLVAVGVYFAIGMKPEPVGTDTTTAIKDTSTVVPVVASETPQALETADSEKADSKKSDSKKNDSQPSLQTEQKSQSSSQSQSQSSSQPQSETKTADKPEQQAEPAKSEKKVQATLETAREATQNGDYKKAFDIYKSLANAGNVEAQYCLGLMYETGTGVDMDIFEAVVWYRKAKAKGFKLAERKLQELGYN